MLSVEWSPDALQDLFDIVSYIEQRNTVAAHSLRETIVQAVEKLPTMPIAFRPGRVPGTRECVVHPNYIVVYRVLAETIEIAGVLHARQQYP